MVPRMSLMGYGVGHGQFRSGSRIALVIETGLPARLSPAALENTGVGATEARATRPDTKFWPEASNTTELPTPATAMSISLRGMNRW